MNRKGRRAILKNNGKIATRDMTTPVAPLPEIEDLHAMALAHRKQGDILATQALCRAILARDRNHVGSLILMGGTSQEQGRNSVALKFLKEALALDDSNARTHDNLALTYQALGRHDEAVGHFIKAIAFGLGNVEAIVKQSPAVSVPMNRLALAWPRKLSLDELFDGDGLRKIGEDGLLLALLQSRVVCDLDLERFLTVVRAALLEAMTQAAGLPLAVHGLRFFLALAQQCFINEYIYPLDDTERDRSRQWCDRLFERLGSGGSVEPLDVALAAMYRPLYRLPAAGAIAERLWPDGMAALLRQQIHEPREEASDRETIPVLTPIADSGSRANEKQYDQNPYPRWITRPAAPPMTVEEYLRDKLGRAPAFSHSK